MKKILYVTNVTRNINSFFIPHINMLLNKGYIVDCACKIKGERKIKEEKFIKKIKFYDIPVTRKPIAIDNFKFLYKLYLIQKNNNYDIIHVHSPIAGVYTRLLKFWFKDVKFIYTVHGFHFHKNSSKLSWFLFYPIERLLARYTDILITINDEDFNVAKKFKCKDVRKISGVGVDFSEFKNIGSEKIKLIRKKMNFSDSDFILIMVGEHNQNKNQIQLIKVMETLSKQNNKIKALLIGEGENLQKNKEYIKENNIQNVYILGFRDDVNDLVNCADVLVSMSYREGLPKNIIEGMAICKPIIATKTRGNEDLVKENYNGYLVSCGDIKDTMEKIIKISQLNYCDLKKMGENSKKLAEKYSIQKILLELEKVYE